MGHAETFGGVASILLGPVHALPRLNCKEVNGRNARWYRKRGETVKARGNHNCGNGTFEFRATLALRLGRTTIGDVPCRALPDIDNMRRNANGSRGMARRTTPRCRSRTTKLGALARTRRNDMRAPKHRRSMAAQLRDEVRHGRSQREAARSAGAARGIRTP